MKPTEFIETFTKWVETQENILASALVGSQARGTPRADSDIDLVIITDNPGIFLNDEKWLSQFGEVTKIVKEDYKLVQGLRVFYREGLEVEYGITTKEWTKTDPIDPGTERVISDGMKILSDREGLLGSLVSRISATAEMR